MTSKKTFLLLQLQIILSVLSEQRHSTEGAVAPPPWADPKVNPCATQPRGWQLLYWPPDGKCYKIFKMGYPCPDDMELSPAATTAGTREFSAECRCPPKTAQSTFDGRCYELFKTGPCQRGQYFAPDTRNHTESELIKQRWGICKEVPRCENPNEIFWPQNGGCYEKLTRGPCTKGQLISATSNGLAECLCNHKSDMTDYYYAGYGCFQHFTKGPCKEKGHLFLPDRSCDCSDDLPHYHDVTKQCFEIGDFAKDAWERLRRCYTNALHRRRFKKSSKRVFPWKFENEMSFLLPFLEVRKSKHENPFYGYDDNQDTTFEEELHIKEDVDNADLDPQDNIVENLRTHFMEQIDADKQCENLESSRDMSNDTGVEHSQRYSESYPYIKPIYQQMCSVPPNLENLDENDMFYLSMSRMTKRLPKLEQAKIKLLLSKSVLEAEIRLEEANT